MKTKKTESKTLFVTLLSLLVVGMITIVVLPNANNKQKKTTRQTAEANHHSATALMNPSDELQQENAEELTSSTKKDENSIQNVPTKNSTELGNTVEPTIVQLTISSEIVDREPVDDLDTLDLNSGRFYTHTVVNTSKDTEIQHVYYFDGNEIARVPMEIGTSPSWRCWSSKYIDPHLWKGEWKIDIESNTGAVLATRSFSVLDRPSAQDQPPIAEQISSVQ